MSDIIAIKNDEKIPRYIGSTMIAPGETKYFHKSTLPAYLREPTEQVEQAVIENPLLVILVHSIKDIAEIFPTLSAEQLTELEALELEGANRSGLAKAIQEERLKRADLSLNDSNEGGEGLVTGVEAYIREHGSDVA